MPFLVQLSMMSILIHYIITLCYKFGNLTTDIGIKLRQIWQKISFTNTYFTNPNSRFSKVAIC